MIAIQHDEQASKYVKIMLQQLTWITVDKMLDTNKDNICPITYDTINLNDNYCICSTCSNSFKSDALIKWVEKSQTCPLCRSHWAETNYIIYNNTNN